MTVDKTSLSSGDKFALCVSFAINHFCQIDGRSYREIAKNGRYSISTLSLAVNGKRGLKIATLQEISESLGVTSTQVISYAQKIFDNDSEFQRINNLHESASSLKENLRAALRNIASI